MSTSAYVLPKLQDAARDYLKAQVSIADIDLATEIISGLSADRRLQRLVVCQAFSAESADVPFSGNWRASLTIQLRTDSDKYTEAEHHDRAKALFDLFANTDVSGTHATPSVLSGYGTDFTAFFVVPVAQRFGIDDPHWVSEIEFSVDCCGSDIS